MSEPPEPNTPEVESADAGFLDLDILVETPVAHKNSDASASSKEGDAKAKSDGAVDGAAARATAPVLRAMPIVDLGVKSKEGEEAVEVGSHGVRRAPLSTPPLPPRPESAGVPRSPVPAAPSASATASFPPPPVRRAASVPSPPAPVAAPPPPAAAPPAPVAAPPAPVAAPPAPVATSASVPAPAVQSFPPPPARPAVSAPPPPPPPAATAPIPPTSATAALSSSVAAASAASPANDRHPVSIVPPDSPAAKEASDLTSIAVLEPESSRLPAAKPNVGEPPLLSGETATTKTGEQPSAVDATPGATPPTAAAKAGPDAFGVRLAEAPPTPTDKTELQVSAETPVSPSKVERPARNLAMVPSAPGTTDELEASEVTIDDAPPSEPSLVHGVRPGAAAVADVSSAEASQADGAEIEAPSNRISEIPPEVDPEDLEISDAPFVPGQFPLRPLSLPGFARPDLAAAVEAERAAEDPTVRRARYWWDEMFGDDFLRTMDRLTDQQIRKEVNFIEDSLGVQQGAIILDLACGSGRHAVELAARGYNVVGYDLSVAMLARAADEAHDRNQKLNFLQGDMRDMGFEEMFDAVYCWATSFGYFDDEKNQLVAQRIHRALRKDGMLLLDVANRDFVAKVQPSLVWFEGDGCVCMDDMRVDFISSRLKVKRMIMMDDGRTRELDYSIRLYTLHELGNMLHDVGFKVIEVSGHTSTPRVFMGADSSRLLVLAEKA